MKAKTFIATLALLAAGSAMADQTYPFVEQGHFNSTRTRADVMAELEQAQARGEVVRQTEYVENNGGPSSLSRAEVQAELAQAYQAGDYAFNKNWEVAEFPLTASTRTREEVREEAIRAARSRQPGNTSSGS